MPVEERFRAVFRLAGRVLLGFADVLAADFFGEDFLAAAFFAGAFRPDDFAADRFRLDVAFFPAFFAAMQSP